MPPRLPTSALNRWLDDALSRIRRLRSSGRRITPQLHHPAEGAAADLRCSARAPTRCRNAYRRYLVNACASLRSAGNADPADAAREGEPVREASAEGSVLN